MFKFGLVVVGLVNTGVAYDSSTLWSNDGNRSREEARLSPGLIGDRSR